MAALIGVGVEVDGGAVGHLGPGVRVLVGDHRRRLVGGALHQFMFEALDVQRDLRVAPLLPYQIGHLVAVGAAVHAVGGNAQVGSHLADDVAHHGGRQNGRVVGAGVVGVVQHDVDQNLRVVRRENCRKGRHLFVVAVGAAVHVQLLGGAGFAADAVARHVGATAAALGAVGHLVLHDVPDGLAGALADDLTADARADLLHHIAVLVGDLIHHVGRHQISAVDGGRKGGAHLQRGDCHGLAEGRGGQLHLAQLAGVVVLHEIGLVGQIDAGAPGEAEGVEVIVEEARPHPLAQLDEVDVAAVAQGLRQILHPVGLFAGAVVGLLGHGVGTRAVEGGVVAGRAAVHPHGRRDDLEDASGVVQLGDGLVFPLDVAEIARVIARRVQDLIAVFVGDVAAVLVFEVDAVELRLGMDQLGQVGPIVLVAQRVVGVKIGLGSHGQDGPGLHVHDDGRAAVLHGVGPDGLVEVPLHHLLDVHVQREHQIGAVLGRVGGGVGVRNGVAVGVAEGDGAAIDPRKGGLIGFFQPVGTVAVRIAEAQHRRRKGPVGVIALEALGGGDGDAPLADAFFRVGFFVAVVVAGHVLRNGKLDGVVHLGRQHLIGRIVLGERVHHSLILSLIRSRRGIHAVQRLAVAGEEPQGDLCCHLVQGALIHGLGGHIGLFVGLGGKQGRAVAGVGPDGPDHAGGGQRDAGGIVDLAAGGLNGAVQQLLLGGVLAVGGAVLDLDVVQAVDDDGRRHQHKKDRRAEAEMPQPGAKALVRAAAAEAVVDLF